MDGFTRQQYFFHRLLKTNAPGASKLHFITRSGFGHVYDKFQEMRAEKKNIIGFS